MYSRHINTHLLSVHSSASGKNHRCISQTNKISVYFKILCILKSNINMICPPGKHQDILCPSWINTLSHLERAVFALPSQTQMSIDHRRSKRLTPSLWHQEHPVKFYLYSYSFIFHWNFCYVNQAFRCQHIYSSRCNFSLNHPTKRTISLCCLCSYLYTNLTTAELCQANKERSQIFG